MRRIAGWLVFVGFLVAVGAGVSAVTATTPTWGIRLEGKDVIGHSLKVTPSGLVLTRPISTMKGAFAGPLTARDAATGRVRWVAWDDWRGQHFSFEAGARWAADVADGPNAVRLLDLRSGTGREVELTATPQAVALSRDERLVFVEDKTGRVALDVETGRRVLTLPRGGPRGPRGPVVPHVVGGGLWLWDPVTRTAHRVEGAAGWVAISPDGTALADDTGAVWDVRDAAAPRRLGTLPVAGKEVTLSDGGRRALLVLSEGMESRDFEVWDVPGGRRWAERLADRIDDQVLSTDGRFCLLRTARVDGSAVTNRLIDLDERREVCTRPENTDPHFSDDSRSLLVVGKASAELIDAATGRTRLSLPMTPEQTDNIAASRLRGRQWWHVEVGENPPAGGWLEEWVEWLRGRDRSFEPSTLIARDLDTLRVLVRLKHRDLDQYEVADDGSFVVTVEGTGGSYVLRRWEVPPRRPWVWIVAVPLLVGAALIGLRAWWGQGTAADAKRSREPAT